MTLSLFAAAYYKRKITQTLPAVTALMIVMFFALGLTGRISHIVGVYLLCIVAADAVFALLIYKRGSLKEDILSVYDPGIVVWLVLVLALIPLFSHVRVFNWDDLHYWAIYPRNMFEVDGAPNGAFACTEYKDYMRGIQFVYYFVFKITGRFSEPAMFVVNNALIITALMPFFERGKMQLPQYLCSIAAGAMIPLLSMFQMLHCLGVDCIMTVFFAYGLYCLYDEKKDTFHYGRIIAVMTALTVTKTAGLVFATVIFAVFLVKDAKKAIPCLSYTIPLAAFALWKLYCMNKGNSTYLHETFEKNLTGGGAGVLPPYAGEVAGDFIRAFFTFGLNGSRLGLTPVMILCLYVAAYFILTDRKKEDRYVFVILLAGMVLYLMSVLYTYLFVFVEWEALSLSSYDRYVSNYMGALLYLAALIFLKRGRDVRITVPVLAICLATLNYGLIFTQLRPSVYEKEYGREDARKKGIMSEMEVLKETGIGQGERVLAVVNDWDDALKLYAQYGAVPLNLEFYDASKEGADPGAVLEMALRDNASYVFLTPGTASGGLAHLEEEKPYAVRDGFGGE